jgi:Xaa-Pro aminopeptidase
MSEPNFQKRLERCATLMQAQHLDALILTKPANMFYLTGDGRLCAYAFARTMQRDSGVLIVLA